MSKIKLLNTNFQNLSKVTLNKIKNNNIYIVKQLKLQVKVDT